MSIFTDRDFNSGNGMQSSIFGPNLWFNLHLISFNYPVNPTDADKKHYKDFLLNWEFTLPCVYCRTNFKKNLEMAGFCDDVMSNRYTFSYFIYDLHNCVNDMLGKNIKISYEEVRNKFENFRSRCSEKERTIELKQIEKKVKKEKGCNSSLYGTKSKSIIKIVPLTSKISSLTIDPKCKTKSIKKHKK
jgi:hypothetical protein